jgi:6-phosphogluconolactonase
MPRPVELILKVSASNTEVTRAAAEHFVHSAAEAVRLRGVARIAISGGSTPKTVFELLASEYADKVPWDKLQLFWVDERCVPPDDPESNYGMTRAAMLSKVPLPAANVHRMEGELDPEEAASRYESEIRNTFRLEGAQTPTFDLIILGLGPDGHTASLFPHTEGLSEMSRICIANHVPQKDTWRMTLTWPVITQGRDVAFLIEGADKAEIVRTVFAGAYDPETYPAQLIRPASGKLLLLLDAAAAAGLTDKTGTTTLELR